MSVELVLSEAELVAVTGYKLAPLQLAELKRQGFYRARRSPTTGRVILERPHCQAVLAGAVSRPPTDFTKIIPPDTRVYHSSTARSRALTDRTPAWANHAAIEAIYAEARRLTAETGIEHHVDHEIPLQGRFISGLHVETNLRVIPAADNIAKGNRFEPC